MIADHRRHSFDAEIPRINFWYSLASFRHSAIVACALNGAQPSPVRVA